MQGIANANYKFITVEVGAYEKQSNGGAFSYSNVYQQFEENTSSIPENENIPSTNISAPFVLLGDDAYPLKTYWNHIQGKDLLMKNGFLFIDYQKPDGAWNVPLVFW